MTYGEQLESDAHAALAQSCVQYPPTHPAAPGARHSAPWHWLESVHAEPVGDRAMFWHIPEVQVPDEQVLPAQHGCPTTPQATQRFPWHTAWPLHRPPAQHGCPTAPHAVAWQ
jgi:hypothetical protein